MANVTATTPINHDSAAALGLLNGEDYIINGGEVTVNSDNRWSQNAAVIGNVNISATLGGKFLIDARDVWWLPFDGGAGTVPALPTLGVQDVTGGLGTTGELLGIFATLGAAPLAPAAAMPATGFVKLRSKVGNFSDNETLTFSNGATALVNSATGGQRGWLHAVFEETSTATVPRLGNFDTRGDWFQLGVTNGADDQTFQYPVTDNCPALQIETAPGSGVYEWFLNAGSRWGTATQFVPTDVRGKYFGCDNATGIITIARRATNSCGFKPATGCRVRIPNIIVSNSTATNWNANTINATLATRWDFTTTSAGAIDIRNVCANWYVSLTSAFTVNIQDSALLQSFIISSTAGATTLTNVAVGLNSTTEFSPVTLSNQFSQTTLTDCRFVRYASSAASQFVVSATDCVNMQMTRVMAEMFGSTTAQTRGNATAFAFSLTRVNDLLMTDCSALGSRIEISQCVRITCNGLQFADQIAGTTTTTNAQFALSVGNASTNILFNGFSNFGGLANMHPRSGILTIANAYFVSLLNVGTAAAPYNMGSANQCLLIANAAVATDLLFRRVYTQNTGTGPFTFTNTVQGVEITNVWGDGADSQAIAALNVLARGCRWTNSVTGQASVYGFHWQDIFITATQGRFAIAMNEQLAETAAQCQVTAGNPRFTSGGQVAMPNVGDEVTWTLPYFSLGHTAFENSAPTITGANTGNMVYEYAVDTGSGFGTFKTLNAANLITETINSSPGFRLRVRARTTVANAANALTFISFNTVTNSTAQQTQYALPFDAKGTISNIIAGSRLQIYNVTTTTEILNQIVPGTSFEYDYYNGTGISAGDVIRLRLAFVNGLTARLPQEIIAVATATGFAALAGQQLDTVYNTNAIDGSLVTELTADFPNVHIDSNDVDGETTVQRIYAWFAHNQFTASGIQNFFNAVLAEDFVNYRIRTAIVNLRLDNVIATPLMIVGGRIYRDDNTTVIAAASNSIQLDPDKAYAVEVSGGGGGGPTAAQIADAVWDELLAGHTIAGSAGEALANAGGGSSPATIAAAVRTELTTELGRIDVATSTRLAAASYTAPPTAAAIRSEIDANSTKLDVAVGTRLATAGYTAPANADVAAIKAKTDQIGFTGGNVNANAQVVADKTGYGLTGAERTAIRTEMETSGGKLNSIPSNPLLTTDSRLNNLDAAVSSRLAGAAYTAPLNAAQTTVAAEVALANYQAASIDDVQGAESNILGALPNEAPTAAQNAAAVRTELATELARVDVAVSTRNAVAPDNAGIAAIKQNTDLIPAAL